MFSATDVVAEVAAKWRGKISLKTAAAAVAKEAFITYYLRYRFSGGKWRKWWRYGEGNSPAENWWN
jgi:hypothetical protein